MPVCLESLEGAGLRWAGSWAPPPSIGISMGITMGIGIDKGIYGLGIDIGIYILFDKAIAWLTLRGQSMWKISIYHEAPVFKVELTKSISKGPISKSQF